MSLRKEILIVQIVEDMEDAGFENIRCHADMYGKRVTHKKASNRSELEDSLKSGKYDYIVFAGHGSEKCLTDNSLFEMEWHEVGKLICQTTCLNPESILILYCCKGGIHDVAFTLIAECPEVSYVFGAKKNIDIFELTLGFNLFLFHVEYRDMEPQLAAKRTTDAMDIIFECYERRETERDDLYRKDYCKIC